MYYVLSDDGATLSKKKVHPIGLGQSGFKNPIDRLKRGLKKGYYATKETKEKTELWKLTNVERTRVARLAHGSRRLQKKLKRESFFKEGKHEQEDRVNSKILQDGQPSGTGAVGE
jgi:hypothetical protein